MIARELTGFFGTMLTPEGGARTYLPDYPPFNSNTNSAYRRACWEEIRIADVPYARTSVRQGGEGASALAEAHRSCRGGAARARLPTMQFLRRYFDEYRGLYSTIGHLEGSAAHLPAQPAQRNAR